MRGNETRVARAEAALPAGWMHAQMNGQLQAKTRFCDNSTTNCGQLFKFSTVKCAGGDRHVATAEVSVLIDVLDN
ncbi:unnamed protein product [Soboliphyme baturini]|uniref:Type I toxin-antitoxin system SymE family toxin n=1 Tax=Soboliphyme baturini TaxID=241478 RepID=A0A183IKV5_9BILA|nr:unnamed protein product [Soboliphyme baturini]